MNKPRAVREGFINDEDLSPFEREEDKPPTKTIEHEPQPQPEADEPPTPADEWPMVIELKHKPIRVGGKEVRQLTLREPSTNDIMNAGGNPCRIEIVTLSGKQAQFSPIIDDGKMLRLIANLSGIQTDFLDRLDPRDYNTIAYQLRRFFLPEGKLW